MYQSSKVNICKHIKHIFEEGELQESSDVRFFRTTADDGKRLQSRYDYITWLQSQILYCDQVPNLGNRKSKGIPD